MGEPGERPVPALVTAVAVDVWRELLDCGGLNAEGLAHVRYRLRDEVNWLVPGCAVDLLAFDVDTALAAALGAEREDMPGAEPVPGSPDEFPPPEPPQRPW